MPLHTMYGAERHVSMPSQTNDGGEITVPYLTWHPGASPHPCEAELLDPKAQDNTTRIRCGRSASDDIHLELELAPRHDYLATSPQPGMSLTLDNRLGFDVPLSVTPGEAASLFEFIANCIAVGAGYASIYYTKRKMPFRG